MRSSDTSGRSASCQASDVRAALHALDGAAQRVPAREWPGPFDDLDVSGLYSWWVDAEGAAALSAGLGVPLAAGRIYAGQTGATKWPSGTTGRATLRSRITGNHLNGTINGSTFRRTLAACLLKPIGLVLAGPGRLDRASETALSGWMSAHLAVAAHPFPDRDALADLEERVLAVLDPPLNLQGMSPTPIRERLRARRRDLTGAPPRTADVTPPHPLSPSKRPAKRPGPASPDRSSHVTLHQEIADILGDSGEEWMTTADLAAEVNRRGRYRKRDGSAVDAFQIHGRTRKYPQLFRREGSRVALVR